MDGYQIFPIFVVDLIKLSNKKYYKQYVNSIKALVEFFPETYLSVNLSNKSIEHISAKKFFDFFVEFGFLGITINWSPSEFNFQDTIMDKDKLWTWLDDLNNIVSNNNEEDISMNYLSAIIAFMKTGEEYSKKGLSITDIDFTEMLKRHLVFDPKGNLYPFFEAIGDTPHNERFKYKELGNIKNDSIKSIVGRSANIIKNRVVSSHIKEHACNNCEYLLGCSQTGFHVYNNYLKKKGYIHTECPTVAKRLFDSFKGK